MAWSLWPEGTDLLILTAEEGGLGEMGLAGPDHCHREAAGQAPTCPFDPFFTQAVVSGSVADPALSFEMVPALGELATGERGQTRHCGLGGMNAVMGVCECVDVSVCGEVPESAVLVPESY